LIKDEVDEMTVNNDRTDLGDMTDMEVVAHLANVSGLNLVDIGCGGGDGSRGLAQMGATVLGLEPDPVQAEKNRAAAPTDNVTLIEAGAQDLPVEDNSADGVMFFRSLHHVPGELMDKALKEAARVLKPGGFLYVLEPAMYGNHYEMMRPFHDETQVRTQAQQALERTADGLFSDCGKYVYMLRPRHESFEGMVNAFTAMSFNGITREMVDVPGVRADFEAARTDDGFVFEQPMLVNVYR
jgi:ubiquinone/menaquinone biosynthesis C-methylase UbiE